MSGLRSLLRERLSSRLAYRLRQLGRIRWLAKARLAREYGAPLRSPRTLRYVLLDPEVGDFSYELANEDEFAAGIAAALGVEPGRVRALFAEARSLPELAGGLRRRLRWRVDVRREPAFGPRLGWYAAVRIRRPALVVETGVRHGIGALVMLAALQRNALEGHDGRLVSVDTDPAAGWMVPDALHDRWELEIGLSVPTLQRALAGRSVDMLVHDTPPLPGLEAAEYDLALTHGSGPVTLVSGSNGGHTPALADLAAAHGVAYHEVREIPDHIYPGAACAVATVTRG